MAIDLPWQTVSITACVIHFKMSNNIAFVYIVKIVPRMFSLDGNIIIFIGNVKINTPLLVSIFS